MMSAMPAVAVRRERSKSKEKIHHPMTKRGRLAEYYHRKISRMGSIGPPPSRTYSTAPTSPDVELPPELLVKVDPYDGRCSHVRRVLGYVSTFHAGCVFIVIGLVMLFISVSTVKADVTSLRGLACLIVAVGATLCFVRTVFVKKPENPRLYVLRLRSSESMNARLACEKTVPTTLTSSSVASMNHKNMSTSSSVDGSDYDVDFASAGAGAAAYQPQTMEVITEGEPQRFSPRVSVGTDSVGGRSSGTPSPTLRPKQLPPGPLDDKSL